MVEPGKALVAILEADQVVAMFGQAMHAQGMSGRGGGHVRGGRGRGWGRGRGRGGGRVAGGRVAKATRAPRGRGGRGGRGAGQPRGKYSGANEGEEEGTVASSPVPMWHEGLQLLGDSMISALGATCIPPVHAKQHPRTQVKQMGLVVHGQTSCQLAKRLERESCPPLSDKGILLLGTNDILKGVPLNDFLRGMEKTINLLLEKMKHITVVSIPPIPRLAAGATNEAEHLKVLNSYNVIIRGLVTQKMTSMTFIDVVPLFLGDNGIRMELYKKDQLHFSDDGVKLLVKTLHTALALKCCQCSNEDSAMN